jgi:ElaB/YqjD/DUF883 family membrane-anchored ribosome-binding protein
MAKRSLQQDVSEDLEALQEEVAQLRAGVVELAQKLLELGKRQAGAAKNGLEAEARDRREDLRYMVEEARKRGRRVIEAVRRQSDEPSQAVSLPAVSVGVGLLLLIVGGVTWGSKWWRR